MASASPAARQELASYCKGRLSASSIAGWKLRRVRKVQARATTDALELHLNQIEKPATQRRVEVRVGDVVDRVDRRCDPLKPAIAGSLTWALRINGSGRDQLAKGGNESVGALPVAALPHRSLAPRREQVRGEGAPIFADNRTPWL
jgi:hypothetical protein